MKKQTEVNTGSRHKLRVNVCEQDTFGCGLTSDWLKGSASFFAQSYSVAVENQLLFDALSELKPLQSHDVSKVLAKRSPKYTQVFRACVHLR